MPGKESNLPAPPTARRLVPALLSGIVGTGLLYSAAAKGSLMDLLFGAVLFGAGLRYAGWPFVMAFALIKEDGRRKRSAAAVEKHQA